MTAGASADGKAAARSIMPLALAAWETGQAAECEQQCNRLLRVTPGDLRALHLAAGAAHAMGADARAVRYLSQAVVIKPTDAALHNTMGVCLKALGQLAAALKSYRRACALDPSFAQAWYNKAIVLEALDRVDQAEKAYCRALEILPGYANAGVNLGRLLQRTGRTRDAEQCYRQTISENPGDTRAWFNLGTLMQSRRCLADAANCFTAVLATEPDQLEALWSLGVCHHELGDRDAAIRHYQRVLNLNPAHPGATHMLAALNARAASSVPAQYVRELFDGFAADFDTHLTESLQYRAPARLWQLVADLAADREFTHVLDLGCGTGLCGVQARPHCRQLTGVDVSPEMLARAADRRIYDDLAEATLDDFLASNSGPFDLFLAADVFVYVGDLATVLAGIRRAAAPGALIAMSTECSETEEFQLRESGRFAHSNVYVSAQLQAVGCEILANEQTRLRRDRNGDIMGELFIARAAAP